MNASAASLSLFGRETSHRLVVCRPWMFTLSLRVCADLQGSGPDLPPEDRLPVLHVPQGSLLRLVCPGGKVS